MSNIFSKNQSFEDELFQSMESSLIKNQTENRYGFDKLAKAADLLGTAAEIFDQAGMIEESENISEIINNLAKEIK